MKTGRLGAYVELNWSNLGLEAYVDQQKSWGKVDWIFTDDDHQGGAIQVRLAHGNYSQSLDDTRLRFKRSALWKPVIKATVRWVGNLSPHLRKEFATMTEAMAWVRGHSHRKRPRWKLVACAAGCGREMELKDRVYLIANRWVER